MTDVREVRRALLAVYDKAGVVELARALVELGVSLVSSGGTAATLRDAGVPVTPVEEVTGFPEMLDGRVKTLHPRIHGGLLADSRKPEHLEQLAAHGIEPFDLVVVNLYPFRETVASGAGADDVIEKIDIGGPAMVRAAAKNFESVGVVVDPSSYPAIVEELRERGGLSRDTRERLAAAAFAHTAAYDAAVAGWFAERAAGTDLPTFVGLAFEKVGDLRYGENPHQRGALYREAGRGATATGSSGPLGGARVLQGKDMSFNNWLDAEAAASLVAALPGPACVIVKHNNPCGVAVAGTLDEAYRRAFDCDTVSAFGGIVAFDTAVTGGAAEAMREVFTEVVIAPGYEQEALAVFGERPNLRLLEAPLPGLGGLDIRADPRGGARPGPRRRLGRPRGVPGRVLAGADGGRMARPAAGVDDRVACEVEHDRARPRRSDGRDRCRPDVEGRLVVDRDPQGGGSCERRLARVGRVLPVPRRARGRRRRGRHRSDPSRGIEGGRRRAPDRGGTRDGRRAHRPPPLPSLISSALISWHRRPRAGVVSR